MRLSGIDLRPCGPGNLADINVAARVHRKTVRRQELAQLGPRRRVAEGATPSSVQRIWKSHGRQLDRDRTLNLSNDPKFAEKLQDVVGLYIAPPDHAIVLSCDVGRLAVHLGSHQLSVGQVLRLPLDRTLVRLAGGCARSRRRRPHRPRRLGGWSTRTAPRFDAGVVRPRDLVRGAGSTGGATSSLRTGAGDRIASTGGFRAGCSADGAGSETDGSLGCGFGVKSASAAWA